MYRKGKNDAVEMLLFTTKKLIIFTNDRFLSFRSSISAETLRSGKHCLMKLFCIFSSIVYLKLEKKMQSGFLQPALFPPIQVKQRGIKARRI